jgi:uncharacterized protein with HEPN domain
VSDLDDLEEARALAARAFDLYGSAPDVIKSNLTARHDVLFSIVMIASCFAAVSDAVWVFAPEIPIRGIRQLRNYIVHQRRDIDLDRIGVILAHDLPALVRDLDTLIARLPVVAPD